MESLQALGRRFYPYLPTISMTYNRLLTLSDSLVHVLGGQPRALKIRDARLVL